VAKWDDGDACYVPYHSPESDTARSWYDARNKCLHLDGDLATVNVISVLSKPLQTVDEVGTGAVRDRRYWIGLQRDPLMKSLSGGHSLFKVQRCDIKTRQSV